MLPGARIGIWPVVGTLVFPAGLRAWDCQSLNREALGWVFRVRGLPGPLRTSLFGVPCYMYVYIYVYIYIYVCMYVCMYIYIYIYR